MIFETFRPEFPSLTDIRLMFKMYRELRIWSTHHMESSWWTTLLVGDSDSKQYS